MRCYLVKESGPASAAASVDLSGRDEVSIGRNPEAVVCVASVRVSRIHAVLTLMGKCWYILDNKSLNGVYVNSKKLDAMTHHRLSNGDLIQLGVPASTDKHDGSREDVCTYRFSCVAAAAAEVAVPAAAPAGQPAMLAAKLPSVSPNRSPGCQHGDDVRALSSAAAEVSTLLLPSDGWLCRSAPVPSARDAGTTVAAAGCIRMSATPICTDRRAALEPTAAPSGGGQASPELSRTSRPPAADELSSPSGSSAQADGSGQQSRDGVVAGEAAAPSGTPVGCGEGRACAGRLGSDQSSDEPPPPKRTCPYAVGVGSPEADPSGQQLLPCSDAAAAAATAAAAAAAEALAHSELVASLKAKADELARAAEDEAQRRRLLEEELAEARRQSEALLREVARARSDALDGVAQLVESELQCCICSELMVKAKSLTCSHSFCSHCIDKWLEQKKECPVCRQRFTGASLSYALDSYIDKVVEQMSEEKRTARRQLVDQRKAEQDAALSKGKKKQKRGGNSGSAAASASADTTATTTTRSAGRRRGHGSTPAAAATSVQSPPPEQQAAAAGRPARGGASVSRHSTSSHYSDSWPGWTLAGQWSDEAVAPFMALAALAAADASADAAAIAAATAPVRTAAADTGAVAAAAEARASRRRTRAQARSLASPVVVLDDSSEEEAEEEAHGVATAGRHGDDGGGDSDSDSLADSWDWPDAPSDGFEDDDAYDDQYVTGDISGSGGRPQHVRGVSGAYYGGYGSCYHCGNRGHWANGCPYR